jgi:hypothetical protein
VCAALAPAAASLLRLDLSLNVLGDEGAKVGGVAQARASNEAPALTVTCGNRLIAMIGLVHIRGQGDVGAPHDALQHPDCWFCTSLAWH